MARTKGHLLILSGPSGTGKTSLSRRLEVELSDLCISVSYTTRPQRDSECDGADYRFISRQDFEAMIEAGSLLEHAEVLGHYYGTSADWVQHQRAAGCDVLLEIDWQGARQVRARHPDSIGIFLLPPDFQSLRQRLATRGQDRTQLIERRTRNAPQELEHYGEYQYQLVNNDFESTLQELKDVISAVRAGTPGPARIDADAHVAALIRQADA